MCLSIPYLSTSGKPLPVTCGCPGDSRTGGLTSIVQWGNTKYTSIEEQVWFIWLNKALCLRVGIWMSG